MGKTKGLILNKITIKEYIDGVISVNWEGMTDREVCETLAHAICVMLRDDPNKISTFDAVLDIMDLYSQEQVFTHIDKTRLN